MEFLRASTLQAPIAALAWLGRQGTRAMTALVFAGIALPPVGALLKPFVPEAVFVLLCTAFLRLDMTVLRGHLRRPAVVATATIWSTMVLPVLFGLGCLAGGIDVRSPDLFLGLMLQATTSPMMAAPALAALMGLDATLVLVALIATSALTPLTAPVLVYLFAGEALSLSPLTLGLKLLGMLIGSALLALIVRRFVSLESIRRHKAEVDGFNVLVLFVFVSAVMGGVAGQFAAAPMATLGLTVFAFFVFFVILGLTMLCLAWTGRKRALALGLMASQRNLGLMLAVTGGALPDLTWLYFALSQFPIYLTPQLLEPLARRLRDPESA